MAGDEIKENSMQIFIATLLNLYGLKSKMLKISRRHMCTKYNQKANMNTSELHTSKIYHFEIFLFAFNTKIHVPKRKLIKFNQKLI